MKAKSLILTFLIAAVLLHGSRAEARVYLDIDSPGFQKFPIAVADFKNLGGGADTQNLSVWFSDTLAECLNLTGYFSIIDRKAFLEDPRNAGITAETIRFLDWMGIGAESLVKGGYAYNGKQLTVEFRLFDVVMGKLVIGKKYMGTIEDRKEMVLKFAGEIVSALTGQKSLFDTKIAFTATSSRNSEIYLVNFDGSGLTKLTSYKSLTVLPRWSPDGKEIGFTTYKSGNPDLYTIALETRREKKISGYPGLNLAGPWSPDGKKMLMTLSKDGNEEIYVLDLRTRELRRLTNDTAVDVSPCWSPDGQRITFVSDRSGSPQIYIMQSDGSNVRRITFEGNYNTAPQWSPRGGLIAFESSRGGNFQVCTISEDGTSLTQLTNRGRNENPSWSPDGRYLTFTNSTGRRGAVCIMNANGSNLRVLHRGLDNYTGAAWSPSLNLY